VPEAFTSERPLDIAIQKGLEVISLEQSPSGAWKGDYGGPLFLVPIYVAGLHILGESPEVLTRDGFIAYIRGHQNEDGGWGLDVESRSHVFTSVLNYVALRLLGVGAGDPCLARARAWFLPLGGALASGSWGKFILSLLRLYEYEGLQPVTPELWLLPPALPIHPSRLWCHCRMVYLPMSYLYGRRARAPDSPLLASLREEIYSQPYTDIDWSAARNRVAPTDAYTPRTPLFRWVHRLLSVYERGHLRWLRERALGKVLDHIRAEDESTNYICIGPINKVLNMLVWHFERPGGAEVDAHRRRLGDYLHLAPDGLKMNGYNSSELWNTAFAVQAIAATGQADAARATLRRAARFIEANQVLASSNEFERYFRHPSRGGWPFSTRDHGWPISDCTAEGLKASLWLEKAGLNQVSAERLEQAVNFILSLQNRDGGWATYERTRGPKWLELLNPSDVFARIMVDYSYVECTSTCIQALADFLRASPKLDLRKRRAISRAMERGRRFLIQSQRPDGSWEGSWGVCFTYGTWFGVWGLVAAGLRPDHPSLRAAVRFLRERQRADGGWSETIESCRTRSYVEGSRSQAVMTSWALLALAAAGESKSEAVHRGVKWLRAQQGPDGRWPVEPIAGVFNRTCAIHYHAYLFIFPVWALAICGEGGAQALPHPTTGALAA
jgi:2,3-oxidosqualene cyclase